MPSLIGVWTQSLNEILSSILPLRPLGPGVYMNRRAFFEYLVSDFDTGEGHLAAFVHIRVFDAHGVFIPIEDPKQVIGEINYHSRAVFTAKSSKWKPCFMGTTALEMKAQSFSCAFTDCQAVIRAVVWRNSRDSDAVFELKTSENCVKCGATGHSFDNCSLGVGICRLDIHWNHCHPIFPISTCPSTRSILAKWVSRFDGELGCILPSRLKSIPYKLSKCVFPDYLLTEFNRVKGGLIGLIYLRLYDKDGLKILIDHPKLIVDELCYHSNESYSQKNMWNVSSGNQTLLDITMFRFQCNQKDCLAEFHATCWKFHGEGTYSCLSDGACRSISHRSMYCCKENGICRLRLSWNHNHPTIPFPNI